MTPPTPRCQLCGQPRGTNPVCSACQSWANAADPLAPYSAYHRAYQAVMRLAYPGRACTCADCRAEKQE